MPLFPGYVFLHGDENARLAALRTNLVVNVLPVPDQRRLHADLVQVYRLLASGNAPEPENNVPPGTPVEIVAGPLMGLEGRVLRHGSDWRFIIEVRFLQQGVSVKIARQMVRPMDSTPLAPRGGPVGCR
jgi:transcription antitermination factor NusG